MVNNTVKTTESAFVRKNHAKSCVLPLKIIIIKVLKNGGHV